VLGDVLVRQHLDAAEVEARNTVGALVSILTVLGSTTVTLAMSSTR